jgi:RNA polymerase sigma-70 factor (ECF subfamily)
MEADREDQAAEDAALLRAHAGGDAHAFAQLYDRYDRPCFRFIRRVLGPAHADAAEDLHQETWIAVSRSAGGFDARKASFAAWLFTIARNKAFDHLRRQKVAVLAPSEDEAAVLMARDAGQSPLEQVETRELGRRLVAAVEALPLEQRGAFVLFADAGLSLEEVARVTGVGVETAKSRLRYARATLRRLLADERPAYV